VDQRHMQPDWRRSTRCANNGCVETSFMADAYLVRDSKEIGGAILSFGPARWMDFITAIKAGEFSNR
jgi:Domain of unknown function (DUF397)